MFEEPVDVEYFWHLTAALFHREPVLKVMPEVISEERSHSEWVVHYRLSLKSIEIIQSETEPSWF